METEQLTSHVNVVFPCHAGARGWEMAGNHHFSSLDWLHYLFFRSNRRV